MEEKVFASKAVDKNGIAVVYVNGTIITNFSGTEVVEIVQEVIETSTRPRIILNLKDVRYIDSYSFGWLCMVRRDIGAKQGEFVICHLNEYMLYLFKITNFIKAVPVYATEEEAREALLSGSEENRLY